MDEKRIWPDFQGHGDTGLEWFDGLLGVYHPVSSLCETR